MNSNYLGTSGMKKDPFLPAAPSVGALVDGSPRFSVELLLSDGPRLRREPARVVSLPSTLWREPDPTAS